MPKEIKIEKPSSELYKGKRKLYCIPLLYSEKDAATDYLEKYEQYWDQVGEHVTKLEHAGKVNKIYHEAIHSAGDDGLKEIEKMNENSYKLVKSCCEKGAELQPLEDKDIFYEFMDWKRCLILPFNKRYFKRKIHNEKSKRIKRCSVCI